MGDFKPNTLYLAIDPSFKGMGVAASFDGNNKVFELSVEGSIRDPSLLAGHLFELVNKLWEQYLSEFIGYCPNVVVLIEMPPPRCMFSAGLFFLVGGLIMSLKRSFSSIEIYSTSASTIKSIHGSRKATKEDSVKLALSWLDKFNVQVDGKLTHNMAEAFILLIYLYQTVLGIEVIKDVDSAERLKKPRFSKLI